MPPLPQFSRTNHISTYSDFPEELLPNYAGELKHALETWLWNLRPASRADLTGVDVERW